MRFPSFDGSLFCTIGEVDLQALLDVNDVVWVHQLLGVLGLAQEKVIEVFFQADRGHLVESLPLVLVILERVLPDVPEPPAVLVLEFTGTLLDGLILLGFRFVLDHRIIVCF